VLNKDIISVSIPSLNPADPVMQALELMTDFHVSQLPVVANEKLIGLVCEDDLLNVTDDQLPVSTIENTFSKVVAHANAFFIEAVQSVNEFNLSVVPVIGSDLEYIGAITANDLLKQLGRMNGVTDPGAVIVLEMEKINFSFSQIIKLVETNDAQITQLNTYSDIDSGNFLVTLKINKFEIADIVATFQRYDYQVKYYFGEELYQNELRDNYDHLMNYLSI
jgi:acetoin utilization protein AcuB